MRDYGVKSIFGGDPNCKHIFSEYDAKLVHENRQNLDGGTIGNDGFREKLHGFGDAKAGFCQKCGAWHGQLGLEPHPQMFIDHLVLICREIKRVLKKSGSFYLNLGDTYFGGGQGGGNKNAWKGKSKKYGHIKIKPDNNWLQPKQLLGIPERVMIALQNDGWILRNKNVWHKLNSMPSSVKDRLNSTWEPVFHFVKARKYYYNLDAIREPHKDSSLERAKYGFNVIPRAWEQEVIPVSGGKNVNIDCHSAGKNPGDILEYDSKYKDVEYGQTAQGFTRSHSKEKERIKSREDAKKLFPNDPKKQQEYINYIHDHGGHPMGPNPGDVIDYDLSKECGLPTIGPKARSNLPSQYQHRDDNPIDDNPKGKNPGDVVTAKYTGQDVNPSEGHIRRGKELHDAFPPGYKGHPLGKNPGDVIKQPYAVQPRDKPFVETRDLPDLKIFSKWLNDWRKKQRITIDTIESDMNSQAPHHWCNGESYPSVDDWKLFKELYNPPTKHDKQLLTECIKPSAKVNNPLGKNPGDVITRDSKFSEGNAANLKDKRDFYRSHGLPEGHPSGRNPGDVIQFDEEYWWNFILGRAHSNRFYKKAYELMRNWMIKNNCFDYAIFYEWYRGKFEGKWESGTLEKGKADYLSDEKRLPFPKPETRFLGDVPGDFWEICTSPFTGYNPDLEHFAVFPPELVLKPLKSSCPKEICKKCGKPKRKVVGTGGTKEAFNIRVRDVKEKRIKHTDRIASEKEIENYDEQKYVSKIKKYVIAAGCNCNAGFDAGIVLDPFCGRGTVGKVAKSLGLHYILFDAKPEYCELARLYIGGQKHKLHKDQSKLGVVNEI